MKQILPAVILVFITGGLRAQTDFSSEDLSYLYDPNAEITIDASYFFSNGNQVSVMLHLVLRSGMYAIDDYTLSYTLSDSYKRKYEDFTVIEKEEYLVKNIRFNYFYRIDIQNPQDHKYLLIFLKNENTEKRFALDLNIDRSDRSGNPGIFIWDYNLEFPVLKNYISNQDSVPIISMSSDEIFAYYYQYDFAVADPPMTEQSGESRLMKIDSTFKIGSNSYLKDLPIGLYFFQTDTNSMKGLSIRVTDKYYPELAKLPDLIDALVYISSNEEWRNLKSAEDPKKQLDRYWINMKRSPSRAKRIIKLYYDKVEFANRRFTTFKEGWKTDKGMVYIVKGPPAIVNRTDDEETWIYEKDGKADRMKFIFIRVPNIFNRDHWVLIRDENYQENWFQSIDNLRKI